MAIGKISTDDASHGPSARAELLVNNSRLLMCGYVDSVEGASDDYRSMTIEKVSEEEHSEVEVVKAGRQTVFEERITRVEETEREVIEEKSIRESAVRACSHAAHELN